MRAAPEFDAVVLAGGHSRRMGKDKALLPHPVSGNPMVLHQLELLAALTPRERIVSARQQQHLPHLPNNVHRVDDDGTAGPLAGIVAALKITTAPHLLVVAVDLPNLTVAVLSHLLDSIESPEQGAFAQTADGPEPLISITPKALHPSLQSSLEEKILSPRRLFCGAFATKMRPVDFADTTPFRNWNHPDDI